MKCKRNRYNHEKENYSNFDCNVITVKKKKSEKDRNVKEINAITKKLFSSNL